MRVKKITKSEEKMLQQIVENKEADKPNTITALGNQLEICRQYAWELIQRLVFQGYLKKKPFERDGVTVTKKGKEHVQQKRKESTVYESEPDWF